MRRRKKRHAPVRLRGRKLEVQPRDRGPRSWFLEQIEASYARLAPDPAPAARRAAGSFSSRLRPGRGEEVFAEVGASVWRDRLAEYRRRKAAVVRPVARGFGTAGLRAGAPIVPGGRNWRPLGPTMLLDGQTVGEQPVAGRVSGIAIAAGGEIAYAATACGGVFRTDDGGATWQSLMDGFDLDPTDFASASLACGAIAIDPADPNRIYVGSGEGDTHQMFQSRVVSALPAYRGVGPIRSDDGGVTWVTEPTAASSPPLTGKAFFALAVDPGDRESVVAATTDGLYQRVPGSAGEFEWLRRRTGVFSSVVVASSGGTTRFFAAAWGGGVYHSTTGESWRATGTGFPSTGIGRIALGVQPENPNRLYAFAAAAGGAFHGVYRLEGVTGPWRQVHGVADVLPGGQGDYDLAIAVDPADPDRIYLGGDHSGSPPWSGSVSRVEIRAVGTGFTVQSQAAIGTHAHADVHVLNHAPGNPDQLWCGCDGGLFVNLAPRSTGQFSSRNSGLSCLCSNFIAQHPVDPAILFTGLQDNGTARTSSGPVWTHVSGGDGGYCLVNWNDPDQVLAFANGTVLRSTTGGDSEDAWTEGWDFPWATMTQPIVSPPFNPAAPTDADLVAVGAGRDVYLSADFAGSWTMSFTLPSGSGNVFALAFASAARLFVGTTAGRVYRADRTGDAWTTARLDNAAAGGLGLTGLISDVAVDWSDANRASIYVTFGGMGDARRVWRYDGSRWEVRSGIDPATSLLDVEHNALVVDRQAPHDLYAGADIGVWHSTDGGESWEPLQNGLPDAPVFDLQIHPTQRRLRAATHGRGLYEIEI